MFLSFKKSYKPLILLVDDNMFIKKLLSKILEAKYRVCTAADGQEALIRMHQTVKPDLIITDIDMPQMNGYKLIKELKANNLHKLIPVCVLSEVHVNEIRKELGSLQVEEIFTKPFDPHMLMSRLERIFSQLEQQYSLSN